MWYNVKYWKTAITIVAMLILALSFTGCVTTKYVPTPITVSENNESASNDSVLNKRFVESLEKLIYMQENTKETKVKQTIIVKDSVAPRYDDAGKKVGEDKFHIKEINTESSEVSTLKEKLSYLQTYKDSCSVYKSRIDSIKREKDKEQPYYIEKKLNVIQNSLMVMGGIFAGFVLIYILLVIRNVWKKWKT